MTKVRAEFGAPWDRHHGPQNVAAEFFHRHNYWLQITYDSRTNSVLAWAVTTCNDSFQPRFSLADEPIQFGRSTLHDVEDEGILDAVARFWRADTIHQPNQLIEFGHLPGTFSFVGLVWGVADVCGFDFPQSANAIAANAPESFRYEGSVADCDKCAKIARRTRINTYGEIYDGRDLKWFYDKIGLTTPRFVAAGPFFAVE